MNVTEPTNLEKEREREENIADLHKPVLPPLYQRSHIFMP